LAAEAAAVPDTGIALNVIMPGVIVAVGVGTGVEVADGVAVGAGVGVADGVGAGVGVGVGVERGDGLINWLRIFLVICWTAGLTSDGLGLPGLILLRPQLHCIVPVATTVARFGS